MYMCIESQLNELPLSIYIYLHLQYISLFHPSLEVSSSTYLARWCAALITHSSWIPRATRLNMLITTPLKSPLSFSLTLCITRLHLWLTVQLLHTRQRFVEPFLSLASEVNMYEHVWNVNRPLCDKGTCFSPTQTDLLLDLLLAVE